MKNIAFLILSLTLFVQLPTMAQNIEAKKIGDRIDVIIDGQFFTSYHFAENEKYPFFFPVNGPSGALVTSMRNGIYPHHSSLFLAVTESMEGTTGRKVWIGGKLFLYERILNNKRKMN